MTNEEALIKCEDYISRYKKLRRIEDFTKNDEENVEFALVVKSALEFKKTFAPTMDDYLATIKALRAERDAALSDLKEYASCDYCKHATAECSEYWNIGEMGLSNLCSGDKWEWRGLENV